MDVDFASKINHDVMSMIIEYVLSSSTCKTRALCKLRMVNTHMLQCVTHYVLHHMDHRVLYQDFCLLLRTAVYIVEDPVMEHSLFKMCEREAGKDYAKRSMLATLYMYLTTQAKRYPTLKAWHQKGQKEAMEKHFKTLCVNKRSAYRMAFSVFNDAVQWFQDGEEKHKATNALAGATAQRDKYQAQVDRFEAKRVQYEERVVTAVKAEEDSRERLAKKIKKYA